MLASTTPHPNANELQAYGQGRLPPDVAAAIEQHVADCDNCCRRIEETPADSFVGHLRDAERAALGTTADAGGGTVTEVTGIPPELADHPRYRVLGLIGQGGMGAVYRAEHRRMQRLVALKVINPGLMAKPATVDRFQQEVRAAARLHHPNIVTAHDADQAGGLHFLVMEYVEGRSLADLVGERGPLPTAEACEYIRQAALGLQHAHEQGMVHRDIKPHNLMLTPSPPTPPPPRGEGGKNSSPPSPLVGEGGRGGEGDGTVKILDFGLARLARTPDEPLSAGADTSPALTGAGTVMGTADYIAPEQATDPRTADIRADIYSLGCTLVHLLTGWPPFEGGTVQEKIARHTAAPLPPLTGVSPALAAVVARMTAKDPAQRYATPAEVAAALAPFVRTSTARPRKRLLIAVALGLVGLIAVAGIVLRIQAERGEVVVQSGGGTAAVTAGPKGVAAGGPVRIPTAEELAWRPNAADRLKHEDVPEVARAYVGGGDPKKAPPELVAVLGNARFRCPQGAGRPAFSLDGKLVAVPGKDRVVLFDAATGRLLHSIPCDSRGVGEVAFSPDGRRLAGTISWTSHIAVWDTATGRHTRGLEGDGEDRFEPAAFSPDGKLLAAGSSSTGRVRFWEVASGKNLGTLSLRNDGKPVSVWYLAFSPDGRTLATRTADGSELWATDTHIRLASYPRADVRFSPDGKLLAVGVGGKEPRVELRRPDGELVRSVPAQARSFLEFTPDSKTLVTGAGDRRLRRWEVESGKELDAWPVAKGFGASSLKLSSDGRTMLAWYKDAPLLWVFDAATGKPRVPDLGHTHAVQALAFSPDGKYLASSDRHAARLWDLSKCSEIDSWPVLTFHRIAFSPDGKVFAGAGIPLLGAGGPQTASIRVYRVADRQLLQVLETRTPRVGALAFSPDGALLAGVGGGNSVRLWRVSDGKEIRLLGYRKDVHCLRFSPDGSRLFASGNDGIKVWGTHTGLEVAHFWKGARFDGLEWFPDGKTLAADAGNVVALLDSESGMIAQRYRIPSRQSGIAELGPAGHLLALNGSGPTVTLWQAGADPQRTRSFRLSPADTSGAKVAFSPDGRYVAVGNPDGTICLLRLAERNRVPELSAVELIGPPRAAP
jgi:WD40 repeat protein